MEQTEIEKKAEEYAIINCGSHPNQEDLREAAKHSYIDGYKAGQKHEADKIFDEWCSGTHDYPQKCGFLKSLEAQIPQWHDLRKNPDDLPKESGDYWCKLKSNRLYTFEVYYTDSLFYKSRWNELDIIAWCELPKFEE